MNHIICMETSIYIYIYNIYRKDHPKDHFPIYPSAFPIIAHLPLFVEVIEVAGDGVALVPSREVCGPFASAAAGSMGVSIAVGVPQMDAL